VPASLTSSGEDLRAWGRRSAHVRSQRSRASTRPRGRYRPAGSVPSLWGLHEFDTFLLVVDVCPGRAFNPAVRHWISTTSSASRS